MVSGTEGGMQPGPAGSTLILPHLSDHHYGDAALCLRYDCSLAVPESFLF